MPDWVPSPRQRALMDAQWREAGIRTLLEVYEPHAPGAVEMVYGEEATRLKRQKPAEVLVGMRRQNLVPTEEMDAQGDPVVEAFFKGHSVTLTREQEAIAMAGILGAPLRLIVDDAGAYPGRHALGRGLGRVLLGRPGIGRTEKRRATLSPTKGYRGRHKHDKRGKR